MKNQTSDLSTSSSESDDDLQEPLISAEAEAVFRSAVSQKNTENKTKNEDVKKEEDGKKDDGDKSKLVEAVPTRVEEVKDFAVGTREEVNGAAAFFFAAGFLICGPFCGVATGAVGSHLAANKHGPVAKFCRKCGDMLDGIGKDKNRQPEQAATSQAIAVAEPHENGKAKGLWSKITDELVHGAEYIEGRIFANRRSQQ